MTEHAVELVEYPLLALRDVVLFPHMVIPLYVGRQKSIRALEIATQQDSNVFLVTQKEVDKENPKKSDLYRIGTVARILQLHKFPDGTIKILVEGIQRGRLRRFSDKHNCYTAMVAELPDDADQFRGKDALLRTITQSFKSYAKASDSVSEEVLGSLKGVENPGRYADGVVMHLPLDIEQKQKVLEAVDVPKRVEMVVGYLQREMEWQEVERRIQDNVNTKITESQRSYMKREKLRKMMDEIKKELGEPEDAIHQEMDDMELRIEQLGMADEDKAKVLSELNKMRMMPPMSAEATVIRNYLDWVLDLPWSERSNTNQDIKKAVKRLDKDHYGLDKVKERILENIAVQMRVSKVRGTILCLVGPPGVGKTSLGRSIAKAMGREFVRISLGGVRDEAEIRGHRKTYIGAMPGRIIKAMKRAGTTNPLILLDEIDKMGMDFRGDPASALLEVLDPEQNNTFSDHYLELDYDLSDVVFITTANTMDIPAPLMDRMEIIRIPGYTEIEKTHIAKRHLIPKCMQANGLDKAEISLGDAAVREIIRCYTREAGVRDLDRNISKICRKVVRHHIEGDTEGRESITPRNIPDYLGVPKFPFDQIHDQARVGLVNGLAWTQVGGEILTIETSVLPGKGKLIYTGSLGEVMQESIQAALSVVRSRAQSLGIADDFYRKHDVHVHVPEGATPKDGPSAGIGMCTALVSSTTGIPVRSDVAMTGEITLRGEVLAIGGLKEKLLAALRSGVKTVIIPEANKKDMAELPTEIKEGLKIHTVKWIDKVLELALTQQPQPRKNQDVDPDTVVSIDKSADERDGSSTDADAPPISH